MVTKVTQESDNMAGPGSPCSAWLGRLDAAALRGHAEWLAITMMRADTTTLALLNGAADEIERLRAAIDEEPELPDAMPDEMWELIRNDRDAAEEALRIVVRLTKDEIRRRAAP